jgi:cyclophilin family peptidyl-prolyl cis-trans isomerase
MLPDVLAEFDGLVAFRRARISMRSLIPTINDFLSNSPASRRRKAFSSFFARPRLELLEDRMAPAGLTLTPSTLPDATFNTLYSQALGATGGSGSYTFTVDPGSISTFPSFLSQSSGVLPSGVLTGTPTTPGTFTFTIDAADNNDGTLTGSQTYTLKVDVLATAQLSGQVFAGSLALTGAPVVLTGTAITGRAIDVATTTGANGFYSFTNVLPGTYSISPGSSSAYASGGSSLTNIIVSQGEISSGNNLAFPGLAAPEINLGLWFNIPILPSSLPGPGSGSSPSFTLDSATPLGDLTIAASATTNLDLSGNFFDPDTTDTIVQFQTPQGDINVQLLDTEAPQAVANYLDYLDPNNDLFENTLFTRDSSLNQNPDGSFILAPSQVLQAGGFNITSNPSVSPPTFAAMHAYQPINLEVGGANQTNTAGTLAMASNGAGAITNQFFFNLTNNAGQLDGRFTVFGQVTNNSPTSLSDYAANFTAANESGANTNFSALPLTGFTPTDNVLTGANSTNLAQINNIVVLTPSQGHLSYSVSSSNTAVVTAALGSNSSTSTLDANQVKLTGVSAGTATVTVTATDNRGETVTKQFTVTVP